jgi:cysteine desulfurase/selenocysteine lyase
MPCLHSKAGTKNHRTGLNMNMNISKARDDTPTFANGIIYLDHAAGSVPPVQVLDATRDYLDELGKLGPVNPALYDKASETTKETKKKLARFINANHMDEIGLTKSGSEAIGQVINGLKWKKGDEVVTSVLEIHAGYLPLVRLERQYGVKLRVIGISGRGLLKLEALGRAINRRTRLVILMHISNSLGTLQPLEEAQKLVRESNALYLVNASQSIGQIRVDVKELDCDFLVAPCRKWLRGPQGMGLLYCRKELIDDMEPSHISWTTTKWISASRYRHVDTAERFEAGELNFGAVRALNRAIDYVDEIGGIESIRNRIRDLTGYLLNKLRESKDLEVYGEAEAGIRGGIVAFSKSSIPPDNVSKEMARQGLIIEAGTFATPLVLKTFHRDKWARVCVHYFNNTEDIDRFIVALEGLK